MSPRTEAPALEADGLMRLHNLEAERSVLGGAMLDSTVVDDVLSILSPDDFWREAHGEIWSVVCDLRARSEPTDAVSIADELERRGKFEACGGDDVLADVANSVPHAANARFHAEIVRQKSVMRRLTEASAETIRECRSGLMTSSEALEAAESRVFAVRDRDVRSTLAAFGDVLSGAMTAIHARVESGPSGLRSGFDVLDDIVGGFKPAEMIVVAARPSMGKTAFGLQVAIEVALGHQTPALFFSLEMGKEALAERALSCAASIDGQFVARGQVGHREMNALASAYTRLSAANLAIEESSSLTVGEMAATARRMAHRGGLGLIVIDYLSLVDGQSRRGESRQEEVARISRGLKALAKEARVPVVVLAQLNRENEKRGDSRPRMADLRESGQIEQDADVILLLHRPEYYDPTDQPGVAEVIVAKNRNGATGTARLAFEKRFTRFDNLAPARFGPPSPSF